MSESTSRSIWDIFAHENPPDIPRSKENETGVDGSIKDSPSCSITSSSHDSNTSVRKASMKPIPTKKVLDTAIAPKESLKQPPKPPVNGSNRRSSPRRPQTQEFVKVEKTDEPSDSRSVSSGLMKGFEKLRTKVKLPLSKNIKKENVSTTGADASGVGRNVCVLDGPVYIKQEPPDIEVKMDFSKATGECLSGMKTQSRHSNIFEMMPILLDGESQIKTEKKECIKESCLTSKKKIKHDLKVTQDKQAVCKGRLPESKSVESHSNLAKNKVSENETVKVEPSLQTPPGELGKDTENLNNINTTQSGVVLNSGMGRLPKQCSKETKTIASVKLGNDTEASAIEKVASGMGQSTEKMQRRRRRTKSINTRNKAKVCVEAESSAMSEASTIDLCGVSDHSFQEQSETTPPVQNIEICSDISAVMTKTDENSGTTPCQKSCDILNKSGEDYLILDSLDSSIFPHAENAPNIRGCEKDNSALVNKQLANTSADSAESVVILSSDDSADKQTLKTENSESDECNVISPLRRSSRRVKAKQFPDSVVLSEKNISGKTEEQDKMNLLAPDLPLDLSLNKDSVMPQQGEVANEVKNDLDNKKTLVRDGAFSVLSLISGNKQLVESQEGNTGSTNLSESVESKDSKSNALQIVENLGSLKMTPIQSSSNLTDEKVCDKPLLPSFDQSRPLGILGSTKKKVIVAEVKPNNAAVLTIPTRENLDSISETSPITESVKFIKKTKVPHELLKAKEQETISVYYDQLERIDEIETFVAFSATEVECLESPTVLIINKAKICENDSVNRTVQKMCSEKKIADQSGKKIKEPMQEYLDEETGVMTIPFSQAKSEENTLKNTFTGLISVSSKCESQNVTAHCVDQKGKNGTESEEPVSISTKPDAAVLSEGSGDTIIDIQHEVDRSLASYLMQSSVEDYPKIRNKQLGKTNPSRHRSNTHTSIVIDATEKDGMCKSNENSRRRSSRMVKPTTKLLEQLEIADLNFDRKMKCRSFSVEEEIIADISRDIQASEKQTDVRNCPESDSTSRQKELLKHGGKRSVQSNIPGKLSNVSLVQGSIDPYDFDSHNEVECFDLPSKKAMTKSKYGMAPLKNLNIGETDNLKTPEQVDNGAVMEQIGKVNELKPLEKWNKSELKGETDLCAFVPSINASLHGDRISFFSEKKVPPKFKKCLKSYAIWRHKKGVISSMLSPEQVLKNAVKFHRPTDTDIRIKELKMGQSWKEHLFDHKTQNLKMPKTLVYVPKANPEHLSFNVPPKYLLTKPPTSKNACGKLQSTKVTKQSSTNSNLLEHKSVINDISLSPTSGSTVASTEKRKSLTDESGETSTKKSVSPYNTRWIDGWCQIKSIDSISPSENQRCGQVAELKSSEQSQSYPNFDNGQTSGAVKNSVKRKSRKTKAIDIPSSGIPNKNIANVIEFSKFLRQSEGVGVNDSLIPDSVSKIKPLTVSPTKVKERSKFNRRVESVKSALHEITKQKVIRKLSGQAPVMPTKTVSTKKVTSQSSKTDQGCTGDALFEPPLSSLGQQKLVLPGEPVSVEVVEVERTSTGEMVLHTQAADKKCSLSRTLSIGSTQFIDSSKSMTDVTALLRSYLEQQNKAKTVACPGRSGGVSAPMKDNDSRFRSSEQEEGEDAIGIPLFEPTIVEANNDEDTTISYNEYIDQEGISAELFEDLTSESEMFPESSLQVENTRIESKSSNTNVHATPMSTTTLSDLSSSLSTTNSSGEMPLLSPQAEVPPKSHSTPRRSPRISSSIHDSPIKTEISTNESTVPILKTDSPEQLIEAEENFEVKSNSSSEKKGGKSMNSKILKRSILHELKSSDGYIADKISKTSDSLFEDPSRLSREERALQRAIMAFSEMEYSKSMKENPTDTDTQAQVSTAEINTAMKKQKEKDNAKKRANQIKKNAVKRSNKNIKKEKEVPKINHRKEDDEVPVSTDTGASSNKLCGVCDSRTCVQFYEGLHLCGACRVFFLRCLKLNLHYKCSKDGRCPILPDNRSMCRGCRLQKCQDLGLKWRLKHSAAQKRHTHMKKRKCSSTPVKYSLEEMLQTPFKKLKLPVHGKKKLDVCSKSPFQVEDEDELPELVFSGLDQSSGQEKSKASDPHKGKAWKPRTPKSNKSKRHDSSVILLTDDEMPEFEEMNKPIVYIDRADMPSPDFGKLYEAEDDADSTYDAMDTISISTTMSVDGCRVKIPAEVKKISVNRDSGESVLHKAARLGYRDVVLWCCQTGYADPRGQDYAGFAPIHECCAAGEIEITKILLAYGADVNVASKAEGVRPLHDAVESDHIEMVRLVLSCGGDPNVSTYSGKSLQDLIGSDEMRDFLQDYSVDLNGPDECKPWEFRDFIIGQDSDEDEALGQSIFDDVPSDDEDSSCDAIHWEVSDSPMIPVYSMSLDLVDGNYALLQDIMDALDMTRLEFTRQIEAHIHTTTFQTLVDVINRRWAPSRMENERVAEPGRKHKAPVDLVRWDARFQELFGIEDISIEAAIIPEPSRDASSVTRQISFTPPIGKTAKSQLGSLSYAASTSACHEQSGGKTMGNTGLKCVQSSHLVKYLNMVSPERSTIFAFQDESFEHLTPGKKLSEPGDVADKTVNGDRIEAVSPPGMPVVDSSEDHKSERSSARTYHTEGISNSEDIAIMSQYYIKEASNSASFDSFSSKDENWNQFNLHPKPRPT